MSVTETIKKQTVPIPTITKISPEKGKKEIEKKKKEKKKDNKKYMLRVLPSSVSNVKYFTFNILNTTIQVS